jgi:hypothetical protein
MAETVNKIINWLFGSNKNAYSSPIEYTNTVKCVNKSSNLDYFYGPYKLPDGVSEPTLDTIPEDLYKTLFPGKTFGIEKDGKIIEYWAQLKENIVKSEKFDFDKAVDNPKNYDLIVKQCVDLDDIEITRIPASDIDLLFDNDPNTPPIDPDYENEATGGTEGGQTGSTEGEGTDFDPLPPPDPESIGGTEE